MDILYLDNAGTALPDKDALSESFHFISNGTFINPHTVSTIGANTHELIEHCRNFILQMYNTNSSEYTCIFTHGATHSIKIIGESFMWGNFVYTKANHNSIIGIRDYVIEAKGGVTVLDNDFEPVMTHGNSTGNTLIAFPAECNFSGKLYDLSWIQKVKSIYPNSYVLLDAAKYCATNLLDLSKYTPDFVPISLYKLIGYPTGLGVLLVKNSSFNVLKKKYYGGGTYDVNIAEKIFSVPRENYIQKYEDGTIPFISIIEAKIGLEYFLQKVQKSQSVKELTRLCFNKLSGLKHPNGTSVIEFYGISNSQNHGTILAFNLKDQSNQYIGYKHVEKLCQTEKIQIRTGCFCNPGACAMYIGLSTDDLLNQYNAGNKCWFKEDMFDGKPTGAIRISFGFFNTVQDVNKFVDFISRNFIQQPPEYSLSDALDPRITGITVFPIKSCLGIKTQSWVLTPKGLKWDRIYAVYDVTNKIITSQRNINLSYIQPRIDHDTQMIYLQNLQTCDEIGFKIGTSPEYVNSWLSDAISQECKLVYSEHALSNRGPVLLINETSVRDINWRIISRSKLWNYINYTPNIFGLKNSIKDFYYSLKTGITSDRFRGNLMISGINPYEEDNIKEIFLNDKSIFKMYNPCVICYTTTINQQENKRDSELEPMKTLMMYRKTGESVKFGTLLDPTVSEEFIINVGDEIQITCNLQKS